MTLEDDWNWRDKVDKIRLEAIDTLREVGVLGVQGEVNSLHVKDLERLENQIYEIRREIEENQSIENIEN